MAKYWTSSRSWTTTINSSTRYLVGSSGGRCNYQTIAAGSTKRILMSNGTNNVYYSNLTIPVPSGSRTFTSSGTFTVPTGVTSIRVFCVGGGGSGQQAGYMNASAAVDLGAGGGGGGYCSRGTYSVSPGANISVTIGGGGSWGGGGQTKCGSYCTANGGGMGGYGRAEGSRLWLGNGGSGGSEWWIGRFWRWRWFKRN